MYHIIILLIEHLFSCLLLFTVLHFPLPVTFLNKHYSTVYDCPLIKLKASVVNGNDGRKCPIIYRLASLCSVGLYFPPVMSDRISISVRASCITSSPGDALLVRRSVLKSPAVTMTTWKRRKKKPGSKYCPCFFNLPSKPHHRRNEKAFNKPALLFLLLTAECDTRMYWRIPSGQYELQLLG